MRVAAPDWELWLILGEDGPLAEEARKMVQVVIAPFPAALARLGDVRKGFLTMLGSMLQSAVGTLRYRNSLARILASLQPDIIHTNGFKMHLLGAWTRPRGTPLVWHIHDYVSTRRLMRRLLRASQSACTAAVVNSKSVASDLRSLLPGLRVEAIYNAVDLERFSPDGPKLDLDAMSGLPPADSGTIRVGIVATFARWKGHRAFLQALARLSSETSFRGYIIGGPIYQTDGSQWSRSELDGEVARLGLQNRVGFTGFLRDTAPAMRSLDIVVHASTEPEPFGMVIVEGMACGKAVIAAQAGGAVELFTDGETALAHAPGDEAHLARQIQRLAGDRELRQRLGQAGRRAAERDYHGKRLAQELLAVYREIGEVSSPAPSKQSSAQPGSEMCRP